MRQIQDTRYFDSIVRFESRYARNDHVLATDLRIERVCKTFRLLADRRRIKIVWRASIGGVESKCRIIARDAYASDEPCRHTGKNDRLECGGIEQSCS